MAHGHRDDPVCDGCHGNRYQESRPVDSYLAHAARRPDVGKEFVEDLGEVVGVFGTHKQGVDHDGVAQPGSSGTQDCLAVEQRLAGLFLDRGTRGLACCHVDSGCPGHVDRIASLHRVAVHGDCGASGVGDDLFGHRMGSCLGRFALKPSPACTSAHRWRLRRPEDPW